MIRAPDVRKSTYCQGVPRLSSHTDFPRSSFHIRHLKAPRPQFFPFHLENYNRSSYLSPLKFPYVSITYRIKYRLLMYKKSFWLYLLLLRPPHTIRKPQRTYHSLNTLWLPEAFLSLHMLFLLPGIPLLPSFFLLFFFLFLFKNCNWLTLPDTSTHIYP